MRRHIRLDQLGHLPTPTNRALPSDLMEEGRRVQAARGLRFDNRTGITRDNEGWKERPSNPADHLPAESEADVMQWWFSRFIANSASRMARGYEP